MPIFVYASFRDLVDRYGTVRVRESLWFIATRYAITFCLLLILNIDDSVRRVLSKAKIYAINIATISNDVYGDAHIDWESVGTRNDFVCENQKSQRLHNCNSFLSLSIILTRTANMSYYITVFYSNGFVRARVA